MRILIALLLAAGLSPAATYFVANAGSDAANGTSAATPWQTIAHVNAQVFSPGDSILFNRGDKWRETLTVPSSGSSGNLINFGAYGSGGLPIVSGANLISGWSATSGTSTVLYDHIDGTTGLLNLRNITGQTVQATERLNSTAVTVPQIGMKMYKMAAPTGNVWVEIRAGTCSSGGAVITNGTSATLDVSTLTTSTSGQAVTFTFATPPSLSAATTYCYAFVGDFAISSTNYVRIIAGTWAAGWDRWQFTPWTLKQDVTAYLQVYKSVAITNVWQAADTISPIFVKINGASGDAASAIASVSPATPWFWASNVLYVYSTSDPTTNYTSPGVESSSRSATIATNTKSYLSFSDLALDMPNAYGVFLTGPASNITAQRLQISYAGQTGWIGQSGSAIDDVTFTNGEIDHCGSFDFYINGAFSRWTVTNSTFHHGGQHYTGTAPWDFSANIDIGGFGTGNGGHVLKNLILYGAGYKDDNTTRITALNVYGFGMWFDTADYSTNPSTITGIVTHNNADSGFFIEKSNSVTASYITTYNNGEYGVRMDCDADCDSFAHLEQNNHVYHVTSYGNLDGIYIAGGYLQSGMMTRNNTIENSVSVSNTNQNLLAKWGGENDGTMGTGNIYKYNDLGPASSTFIMWGSGVLKTTYSAWETSVGSCGSAGCSQSIQSDPQLNNPGSADFTLKAISPARNAGLRIGGIGQQVSELAPDIGAYEYVPGKLGTLSTSQLGNRYKSVTRQ